MASSVFNEKYPYAVPRKRNRQKGSRIQGYQFYAGGSTPPHTEYDLQTSTLWEETQDRENLWPFVQQMLRRGGVFASSMSGLRKLDLGWNFFNEKISRSTSLVGHPNFKHSYWASSLNQAWGFLHEGPVFLNRAFMPAPWTLPQLEAFETGAFGLGGTAIRRSSPNKPLVDLAVTIGELRSEGLPSLIGSIIPRSKTVRDSFRNGGREYLNAQFGWAPLLRDVQGLAQVVLKSREIIEQYHRDLTREIRRRYTFPTVIDTTQRTFDIRTDSGFWVQSGTPLGDAYPNYRTFGDGSSVRVGTEVIRTETKAWFSGAFRYYNATAEHDLNSLIEFEENANLLLGTRLDPEVLWNLQPWTWLVDWFVNYGDILGNFSSIIADHQIMHYGYIMRESSSQVESSVPGLWARDGALGTKNTNFHPAVHNTVRTVRKLRASAYPFGFGLDPDGLSPSQWAILGALGVAKGL